VISSLTGTDFAVLVTEPTPSGLHDLERVADLCRHFTIPTGVIVNKADLNPYNTNGIKCWCDKARIEFLGTIDYDPIVTEAMIQKKAITEFSAGTVSIAIRRLWDQILDKLNHKINPTLKVEVHNIH
jgi:MinD superfamily P-loop ATPase